jgi:hypothetical protein
MAELSKQALKVDNNQSFPNNNNGAITPSILRAFNTNMIDSMVDEIGYNVDSASWNQQIDALEQFTASAAGLSTGSLLVTASAASNVITFTKGDSSQFSVTVADTTNLTPLNDFTSSQLSKDATLATYTGSVNNSLSNLNTFTQSANTQLTNLASSQSIDNTKWNTLGTQSGSWVTESESGSFLITASVNLNTITFTKGNNTTFAITVNTGSGGGGTADLTSLNAFTASQLTINTGYNTYTSSTNSRLTNIESTTASLNSSITQLNASSASQQVSINNLNTTTASLLIETQNLELFTASANTQLTNLASSQSIDNAKWNTLGSQSGSWITESETGSFVTTASFNSYTSSTNSRLTNIESTTASLLVETQNLELFSASALTSISNLNTFTQSQQTYNTNNDTKWSDLGSKSGSWVTESETGSFARYDVSNPWSANQTFTNISAVSASFQYVQTIFETASVIYSSGSNQFGDALNDTQTLYGNVLIIGSGSINSNRILTTADTASLSVENALTSSITRNVVVVARNGGASTLPAGTVVHITSAVGDNPVFTTASYDTETLSSNTFGLLRYSSPSGADVEVVVSGIVTGVNTDPALGYTAGDIVYLSSSGQFTRVQPQAPNQIVTLGQVLRAQQNNGSIYVSINNGWELNELHNVQINNAQTGDLLQYESSSYGLWKNRSISGAGITTTASFNAYTQSNDTKWSNLASQSGSWITESETGSFAVNIGATTTPLQFQVNLGNGGENIVTLVQTPGIVFTGSFNAYTQSNDAKVNSLISATGSYATTGSNTFTGQQNIQNQLVIEKQGNPLIYTLFLQDVLSDKFIVTQAGADGILFSNINVEMGQLTASLQEGYVWVGDNTGKTKLVATSSFIDTINTGSFATTGSNTFNGNQIVNGVVSISSSAPYDLDITGAFQATAASRVTGSTGIATLSSLGIDYTNVTSSIVSNLVKGQVSSIDGTGAPTTSRRITISANPSVTGLPGLTTTLPSIITTGATVGTFITPIQFQHIGAYTDGRVSITTPLSASAGFTSSLQDGFVWVGNSLNQNSQVATSSFVSSTLTGSFATTGSNTFTGNQTVSASVFVSGTVKSWGNGFDFEFGTYTTDFLGGGFNLNPDKSISSLQMGGNEQTNIEIFANGGNYDTFKVLVNSGSEGTKFQDFPAGVEYKTWMGVGTSPNTSTLGDITLYRDTIISGSLTASGSITLAPNYFISASVIRPTSAIEMQPQTYFRFITGSSYFNMQLNPGSGDWAFSRSGVSNTKVLSLAGEASNTSSFENNSVRFLDTVPNVVFDTPVRILKGINSSVQITGSTNIRGEFYQSGSNSLPGGPNGATVGTHIQNRVLISDAPGALTPRLYISGSDGAYSEYGRGFQTLDTSKVPGLGAFIYTAGATDTLSVNTVASITPDYSTDVELQMFASTSSVGLADWDNGSTFSYVPFMTLAPNNGDNPAPQFKRSISVTGSVSITNVMNLKAQDPLPTGTIGDLAVSGSHIYFYNGAWTQLD